MCKVLFFLPILALVAGCSDGMAPVPDLGDEDAATATCGDGVVDPGEECDRGNDNRPGSGCEATCKFSCYAAGNCDDHDPCNGAETCSADHTCAAGTPLDNGASCGDGKICNMNVCLPASCGDGIVTAPEECDDGNAADGDGCQHDCTFSCVPGNAARGCTPADPCLGEGICQGEVHTCAPGTPLGDGTACPNAPANYCKGGVCTKPVCGNGTPEPGEICDDGNTNADDGCRNDCTFSCVTPATDCGTPPACQKQTCTGGHTCQAVADVSKNGSACGSGLECQNGACLPPTSVCGNGKKEAGEDCDLGADNGPGKGCETTCTFSCTVTPDSCPDANPCNGVERCDVDMGKGQTIQKCLSGKALTDGTSCGTGNICLGAMCKPSQCGDGWVDAGLGEECDPPASGSCTAACKKIVCGNARRDPGEQCDDGNTTNLDGCDSACRFEQDHRVNSLSIQFGTDSFCTSNRLGAAVVGSTAQNSFGTTLSDAIKTGKTSINIRFLGLDDLTGTSDPSGVQLGILNAVPATGTNYDGTNDLDWWYATDASSIDSARNPVSILPGTLNASNWATTTPTDVSMVLAIGGTPQALRILSTQVKLHTAAMSLSTPLSSTGGTPGHLSSELLDPALKSFGATDQGELCGNVASDSLNKVPLPDSLVGCGVGKCTKCYTASNHLLDAIVGGCDIDLGFLGKTKQLAATQPDKGPATTFTMTGSTVTGCVQDTLAKCLANSSYSSFFKLTTDRVILK